MIRLIPAIPAIVALIPAWVSLKARTFDDRASCRMLAGAFLVASVWAVIVARWAG